MQQLIGISLVLATLGAILWVYLRERSQTRRRRSEGDQEDTGDA
jgi:hypothetical protein